MLRAFAIFSLDFSQMLDWNAMARLTNRVAGRRCKPSFSSIETSARFMVEVGQGAGRIRSFTPSGTSPATPWFPKIRLHSKREPGSLQGQGRADKSPNRWALMPGRRVS
jgi:hypothetical protein